MNLKLFCFITFFSLSSALTVQKTESNGEKRDEDILPRLPELPPSETSPEEQVITIQNQMPISRRFLALL
jgi:hypothetical protein